MFGFTGQELFWGFLGGFLAAYLVYYIFSFFIGKITKWEHDKVFKMCFGVTALLLFTVSEHTWLEKLVFYTLPLANIFYMEYKISTRKCPHCNSRNKRQADICVHCGKKMAV